MQTAYIICMVVGLLIPLLTLFFDAFDSVIDIVSIDLFDDMDISSDFAWLPLSINSISMGVLMFGAMGLLLKDSFVMWKVNLIAAVVAYICAVIVQTFIRFLKKQKHFANDLEELVNRNVTVSNAIAKNGFGAVSMKKEDASIVNCPAKSIDGESIAQGENVKVVSIKDSYVIVSKTDK